jgi:hypothetical protein
MANNLFHLVPKKHHHKLEEVCESGGTVEVVLKRGWEYDVGSSLACYERGEFCRADGAQSEAMLKRCIADEISRTDQVPVDEWDQRH